MNTKELKSFVVLDKTYVGPSTFVLRFTRNDLVFKAGQTLSVGVWDEPERREYSIFSSEEDDFLEILVKIVENGKVSNALRKTQIGDRLNVHGPGGFFVPPKEEIPTTDYLFIATGTGFSPYRSIVHSNPGIDYRIIHGIRTIDEAYGAHDIPSDRYITCVSREQSGTFQGRVTTFLKNERVNQQTMCYLCGNCEMIYDVYDILLEKGIPSSHIQTEVYF